MGGALKFLQFAMASTSSGCDPYSPGARSWRPPPAIRALLARTAFPEAVFASEGKSPRPRPGRKTLRPRRPHLCLLPYLCQRTHDGARYEIGGYITMMHGGTVSSPDPLCHTLDVDNRIWLQQQLAKEAADMDPRHMPLASGSYTRTEIQMHMNRELEQQEEQYWAKVAACKRARQQQQQQQQPTHTHEQQAEHPLVMAQHHKEDEHRMSHHNNKDLVDHDNHSGQSWRSTISVPQSIAMGLDGSPTTQPNTPMMVCGLNGYTAPQGVVLVHTCMGSMGVDSPSGLMIKHQSG